ncbi:aminotransferase class V-fold PLP-dependent enzyme [Planctomicrobium piriforme]|uniref:cysteine desulfurase n=1 Tax=Planctomicrobium piriforme TaxID=1576369 RepID=A0A1I3QD89_9PLAN|nr:aminotransferase class V-fold PLP-dependent enzyme [Planctomicrobium piriforme]SFJ31549.1 cysteine desulfurase family protein [Planctomicrobium piriforme]
MPPRIYLDHAATSFPKPEAVALAMVRYLNDYGSAPGRSATRVGLEVQRVIDRCRQRLAALFGASRPEQVIFTLNGTDSLNLAIHGSLKPGDRVVTTVWEHNSVLRPLHHLQSTQQITVDIVPPNGQGQTDLDAFAESLKTPARLVVLNHASNVTGVIQPVAEMARIAREAGALVLLDAAQTAGHVPVSLTELGVDLIACPGHKGLLGPLGTGVLVLAPGIEKELQPVRQGGTGTASESAHQPATLPDRYESGNLNAPGIFGLEAALATSEKTLSDGVPDLLIRQFISGLQQLPGVIVYFPEAHRVGVVSASFDRIAPQVLATLLDEHFGIETRAGLHCAPRAHAALGTLEEGGTVRFSLGHTTTAEELDLTLEALAEIAAAM